MFGDPRIQNMLAMMCVLLPGMVMSQYEDLPKDQEILNDQYDFIVVGAGCAGSVLASRLTEMPNWSVLLLEAGRDENILADVPLMSSYLVHTDYNWAFLTDPSPRYCTGVEGGRCKWPQGRAMGGSSVINYMLYTRGNSNDYDEWERLGNEGWNYHSVLPYFLKSENIGIDELKKSPYHAKGGYLDIQHPPWTSLLAKAFLEAGKMAGYETNDPNGENQTGFSIAQTTMRRGVRLSASRAFLSPVRRRSNLHVAKNSHVTKVIIDSKTNTSVGVEFIRRGRLHKVNARKEVIISAGSINSPKLLILSGIGPRDHLEELGIPVLKDLKVGYNLQDHVTLPGLVFVVNQSVTIVEKRILSNPLFVLEYILEGRGPYTSPGGAEVLAFLSSDGAAFPDVELVFGPGALSGDYIGSLRKALGITPETFRKVYGPLSGRDAWTVVPVLLKPHSRGRVSLRTKNPFDSPRLDAGYYEDPRDTETLLKALKMALSLSEKPALRKFNSTLSKIPLPACDKEGFGSDKYWMCAIRNVGSNLQHQVGTCKMGPADDPDAVVDPELRVKGVRSLRVVDSSIIPVIPAAHTMAPVYMIAERAADLIKADWYNDP